MGLHYQFVELMEGELCIDYDFEWNSTFANILARGCRDLNETPRVEFFFSAARGRPTYYVIRHWSIYGNSDIIA